MLKRQESLLSTSRREATTPPPEDHHAKHVGCMSGIFELFSKYHNRKKLLTFGRKHEKKAAVSSPSKSNVTVAAQEIGSYSDKDMQNFDTKRLSNDMSVPRSPVLSQKIRLPKDAVNLSEQLRTPPALMARLMGLEEQQTATVRINRLVEEESTEEKRQKLLQALEKCNEDLEALKKIIKAVQSSDCGMKSALKNCADEKNEKLSPVCVLDQLSPSSLRSNNSKLLTNGIMPQQSKKIPRKKPGEDDDGIGICFFNIDLSESFRIKPKATAPSVWSSKTMLQSVDEVCNDIVWGEKREVRNIGLMLQNHICRDLIEEIVKELGYHMNVYRLPFEACRRRLSF